jgi:putative ABC transport system substrate-binding protein
MPVVGFLSSASLQGFSPYLDAFRRGLSDAGFVEGRNIAIEYRWADNEDDRLPVLAEELLRARAVVLAVPSFPAVQRRSRPRRTFRSSSIQA